MHRLRALIPGLLILAICAWLYGLTLRFDSDPLGMTQGMPATHMPQLVLTIIAALTVLMMWADARTAKPTANARPPWKMWVTAGILALAAMLFEGVGLPLVFFAVCISIPLLWGARQYRVIGVFAVALPTAIVLVFQGLLGLRLPLGVLAFLG